MPTDVREKLKKQRSSKFPSPPSTLVHPRHIQPLPPEPVADGLRDRLAPWPPVRQLRPHVLVPLQEPLEERPLVPPSAPGASVTAAAPSSASRSVSRSAPPSRPSPPGAAFPAAASALPPAISILLRRAARVPFRTRSVVMMHVRLGMVKAR